MARVTPKCRAVIACCPGVADERLRLLGWEPAADADAALARALELSGATGGGVLGSGVTSAGALRSAGVVTNAGDRPSAARGLERDAGSRLVVLCPRAQRALFVTA